MSSLRVAAGVMMTGGLLDKWAVSLFNVPLTVIGMAAAGALLSFAYDIEGEKPMKRSKLYFLVFANTVLASAAVSAFPYAFDWKPMSVGLAGSVALLLAAAARFFIPAFIKLPGELIRKWFKLGEYSGKQ